MPDHGANLPIGVLIPTRNCAGLARDHVASLQSWAGMAQERVVVDSDSQDGTVEILKAGLSGLSVKYLTHPPGLYQSWNFGIQNISAKYVYISTVGDSITRGGLEHLFGVAEKFQCDVAMSKPQLISAAGTPARAPVWPMDDMLACLNARESVALEGA
jgi:glycosyltransferase involved in cell wall biosynthesis